MKNLLIIFYLMHADGPLFAQTLFQNLDFEKTALGPIPLNAPGELVPFQEAFPFWSGFYGSEPAQFSYHNSSSVGGAIINIQGPDLSPQQGIIDAAFSAQLQVGTISQGTTAGFASVSLFQNGFVPETAHSILFKAAGRDFIVSLGGERLELFALESGPNYTLYGADVARFSGATTELRFEALSLPEHRFHNVYLDSISFSPEIVPEPSIICLSTLGLALLYSTGARARRSSEK